MGTTHKRAFVSQRDIRVAVQKMHRLNARILETGDHPGTACQFALAITGACGHLVGKLTDEPGASKTLITEVFPYNQAISQEMVGNPHHPDIASVSEEMAIKLAIHARATADQATHSYMLKPERKLNAKRRPRIIGLGITAAIQTERTRKGSDRAYLALAYPNGRQVIVEVHFPREGWEGTTPESRRSLRKAQSLVLEVMALNLMLHAMGLEQIPMYYASLPGKVICPDLRFGPDGDTFTLQPYEPETPFTPPASLDELRALPIFSRKGRAAVMRTGGNPIYVAGSLNPFTPSHEYMGSAGRALGYAPVYLMDMWHPDKLNGMMELADASQRLASAHGRVDVLVTFGLGYFADKMEHLRGTFAIGYDVFLKLVDRSKPRCLDDLARIKKAAKSFTGPAFIVFPRNGKRLDPSLIPEGYADLFVDAKALFKGHSVQAWRESRLEAPDLSSTLFRNARAAAQPPKRA